MPQSTGQDQHHRYSLLYSSAQYAPKYSANVSLWDVSVGVFSLPMILALGKKVQKDNLCKRPPFDAEATIIFVWDNGSNGAKHLA